MASAQCTPVDCLDQLPPSGGLCASNFQVGRVNTPYDDAISFHVTNACTPASLFDPTLEGASIRITQLGNITFTNLSAGLSGSTNQATYTPPANGCGSITGIPTEVGVFAATVNLSVNVNVWPFSLSCGGFGPIAQPNQSISEARELIILPDPTFTGLDASACVTDADVTLTPTGTTGGTFSGPGVVGNTFSPALAGIGTHEVKYVVSAQEGAAIAPATDSLTIVVTVIDCAGGCFADAGSLSGGTTACLVEGEAVLAATADGNAEVPAGYETIYVLTEGAGLVIVDAGAAPEFTVDAEGDYTIHTLVYDPNTLDLSIVEFGVTTGFDVNGLLIQGGGTICASLDVAGAPYVVEECVVVCDADAGTLTGGGSVCVDGGSAALAATADGNAVVPDGYQTAYVLTEGPGLVIIGAGSTPDFVVDAEGDYTIHTLVYDPNTLDLSIVEFGVTTGFDVNSLLIQGGGTICASLDVSGAAFSVVRCCPADAGTLTAGAGNCLEPEGVAFLSATPDGNAVVPPGFITFYVLTSGEELVIQGGDFTPAFLVDEPGLYTIHTLVLDPNTLDLTSIVIGETTGFDVNALLVQGGGSICASLDVAGAPFLIEECVVVCDADAGTLTGGPTNCITDGGLAFLSALPNNDAVVPPGFLPFYVLTRGNDQVIIAGDVNPAFLVDEPNLYTIHTLVLDPATLDLGLIVVGVTTAAEINALLIQGGGEICASLDLVGAPFLVQPCCSAEAGTLSGGATLCFENEEATLTATADGNAVVPANYETVYVLTQGEDLVIIDAGAVPEFTVDATGTYTIHTLVYDPATLDLSIVVFGETTGFDVNALLVQGGGFICGSLDVAGAAFTVELCCDADAGTLSGGGSVCFENEEATLTATADGNAVVLDGFETIYVLTAGEDLVIIDAGAAPEFTVDATGDYTIHTLVYDPNTLDLSIVVFGETTGFDVNGLLIQGGGTICASLDVAGAAFTVELCCDADAGTLSGGGTVCFENEQATLTATADGNAVVPDGFETIYVLTAGEDLVIIDAGAAPEFTVDAEGDYTIHTLVHDPNTLDLSIVEFGVTTGFDVNGLLIQGGGTICASLDVAGAAYTVEVCVVPCDAVAGTLSGGAAVCLEEGEATLVATADGNAVVPAGYETIYVLTAGSELVIINAGAAPEFTVDAEGDYTIHTLVYDPNTLDLSIVEFGVTTGFDVNALLIQGGGDICASLDVAGTAYTVEVCLDPCDALAGTLSGGATVCLEEGEATLTATADGNAVVPAGFETIYVLTAGSELVIIDAGASPEFTVDSTGNYTIHTLVYDPNTLDLSIVEFGVTTGFDVNALLIQGGGDICASLDVAGAAYVVEICTSLSELGAAASLVYPNPSMGDFTITFGVDAVVVLELMDMSGRLVHTEQRMNTANTPMQVQLAGRLAPGTYVLRMSSELGRSEQRIVIGR